MGLFTVYVYLQKFCKRKLNSWNPNYQVITCEHSVDQQCELAWWNSLITSLVDSDPKESGTDALAACSHCFQPFQTPFQRFSKYRSGTYNNAVTAIAISIPISPVVCAIGPVYQTCSIDGMMSAKLNADAIRAAAPSGSRDGTFQDWRSYSAKFVLRK